MGQSGRSQYDRFRGGAEIRGSLPGEYSASSVATGWRLANQMIQGSYQSPDGVLINIAP